jgi:hypothetical protein
MARCGSELLAEIREAMGMLTEKFGVVGAVATLQQQQLFSRPHALRVLGTALSPFRCGMMTAEVRE